MIYLSEKVMNLEDLFIEKCFTKRGDAYYFASEIEGEDKYLCVKLWNKFDNKRFELEIVRVYTKGDSHSEEIIEAEEIVTNEKDRENAIYEFFYYLSYEDNSQNVMMFEGILEFIKEYIEDAYFYADDNGDSCFKNTLYGEFMELFQLKGEAVEGYYEGNLVLVNVELINKSTNEIIKSFEKVNLASNFYVEEDDDVDYIIEAYLESMSEDDIKEKFLEVIRGEEE